MSGPGEPRVDAHDGNGDDDEILVLRDETVADDANRTALVERLHADPTLDAVGVLVAVVDAVKQVGPAGVVERPVDRADLVTLGRPLAVRRRALDPVTGTPRPRYVAEM